MEYVLSKCACFTSGGSNLKSPNLLSCAPCPPLTFTYNDFVSFAEQQNLSTCEIGKIASKCGLEEVTALDNMTDVSLGNGTDGILPGISIGPDQLEPWIIAVIVVSGTVMLMAVLIIAAFVHNRFADESDTDIKSNGQIKTEKFDVKYTNHRKRGLLNAAFSSLESLARRRDDSTASRLSKDSYKTNDETCRTNGDVTKTSENSELHGDGASPCTTVAEHEQSHTSKERDQRCLVDLKTDT